METVAETCPNRGELVRDVTDGVAQSDMTDTLEVRNVFMAVVLHELCDSREVLVL